MKKKNSVKSVVCKKPATVSGSDKNTKKCPTMPKVNGSTKPKALWYKGCRIYSDLRAKSFRVLTEPGNNYSELRKGMGWKTQSVQVAWKVCISSIDKYMKS